MLASGTVTKSCSDNTCVANNADTACCNTANCNIELGSCIVGTGPTYTQTACAGSNYYCTNDITTGSLVKSCSMACLATNNIACCSSDNCNTNNPIVSCRVGNGAGTNTACTVNHLFCKTEISGGNVVKSCAAACTGKKCLIKKLIFCSKLNNKH